jgi:fibronectin-binding autotransporter adhesin
MRIPNQTRLRPITSSLSRFPSAAAFCAALALASAATASAATFYWDADGNAVGNDTLTGTGLGGVGVWSVSGPAVQNWFDPLAPASDVVWPNTNPNTDTAVFTGTGGAVTMNGPVFVNALRFDSNGYTITNGGIAANTLNLSGTSPAITVTNGSDTATISALISGTQGLVKTGAGRLTLGLTGSTFTGNVLVEGGTLAFNGSGNADQTALGSGAKTITLTNNATLALIGGTDADPNVASGKGFVIGTGGGTIDVTSGRTFFLNDGLSNGSIQNQLQGSGTLTKAGAGILNVGRDFSSTFTGDVNVNAGRLDLTVANAVGNAGTITVDGATARLNLNSTTAFGLTNNVVLQNGATMTLTGANHNLPNNKSITIGAGTSRIRVDDGGAPATNRTFVLNGPLNGSNTLEVPGPTGATRGVLAISNAAGNFSGTIVIDKNVSVENFARFNGTTPTNNGKTIGTATIKFAAIAGGSGSTADGQLDLRDAGTGNNQVLNYGNNIDMTSTGGIIAVGTATSAPTSVGNRFVLGSLGLGAGNTITVNTTNNYSLEFAGATTLGGDATFTNAADLRLSGGLSGGANITKNGAGQLYLGALAGPAYTGNTTINGGGIVFTGADAIGGTGQSVTLANNSYIGANFVATQANLIDRLVPNSNQIVIALGQDTSSNLNITAFPNARLGAVGTATYTGTLTHNGTIPLLGGGGGTLILPGTNVITGTGNLDVGTYGSPAGVVALDSSNDFTGTITLSGGQLLRIASDASLGNASNVIVGNGGGIQFKAGTGYDIFATRTINFTGGFILDTNGFDLTPAGAIGNGGAGGFTKAGNGKLTLSAPSTYLGKTVISGGTLSISAEDRLGAAPGASTADQLQIQSGGELEATATFSIAANRGIQLNNGGGAINVTGSNTLTIPSTISGLGSLTKNGPGTLTITADPNHTGGFTINGGVLALAHGGSTDGHVVINNTGTLRVVTANDLGDAFNVTVNSGGTFDLRANDQISQLLGTGTVLNDHTAGTTLTVSSALNATFGGVLQNGVSALGFTKSGANVVTLTGANTYTGTTTVNSAALVVSGPAGAILGSTAINVGDNNGGGESLTLGDVNDVVPGALNRLTDTANLTINGTSTGGFAYNGPAAGSGGNVETVGTITAAAGRNSFTINAGTNNEVQLTTGTFVRSNNGTVLFRGANLGGTGVGSARIVATNPAGLPLSGAGGADGSTNKSIIPFAIGDNSATGAGSGFVTYDAVTGVRLLTSGEYDSSIAGNASLRNVSSAGGETVSSDVKINSLRLTGTAATTIGAGTRLTVNSGAVLFTDGSSIGGAGALDFGSSEGVVHLAKNTTGVTAAIDARIAGSNGLTLGRSSDVTTGLITLGGDNTVVGNLIVNQGTVNLTSATALNDNVPMTVLLRPNSALGLNGNNVTIRDLQGGGGTGTFQNNSVTTPATLTTYLTGNRTLTPVIQNGGAAALNLIVSGNNNTLTIDADAGATGSFEQRVGVTQLSGANGTLNDFTSYAVNGGTVRLTNALNSANGNRLRDASALSMNGGTLDFDNNATAAAFSETVGAVTLNSGGNTITVDKGASTTNTSILTMASLARNAGATLNLTSQNNGAAIFDLGTAANSRLVVTAAPTLDDGILGGWATIDSSASTREFVKYVGSGTISATALVTADYATALPGATATQNVKITASPAAALTGNTQVNSLNVAQASATTVDIGASNTLRIESGGVIMSGAFGANIDNGTLTAGNGTAGGDLIFHTVPAASSGLTWTNAADTVTLANVVNGTPIVFSTTPAGLTAGVTYFAVNSNGSTFQLATAPGGSAIAITNDGTTGALTQALTNTVNSVIADNGASAVNLVKAGSGVLALAGANTYTGKTFVNGGFLRISNDSNLGTAPASPVADSIVLSNGSVLDVTDTMTLHANRGIRVGAGNNVIAIASGTAGNGKTLTYDGAISPLGTTEGSLQFRSNVATTNGVDPGKFVANLTGLNVNGSFRLDAGNVTTAGATSTIGRGLQVGMDGDGSLTYTSAGGSLTVGKGINDVLEVGVVATDITPALGTSTVGTLDVSALSNFTANLDTMRIGIGSANQTGRGIVKLAANNDITAGTSILLGNSAGQGQEAINSSVAFGSGTNNVTTKVLTVGGLKSNVTANIAANGILNLNGFGVNTLDVYVARNNGSTSTIATGNLDTTGGTLNASLNNLIIGEKTGGGAGGTNGTLTVTGANNNIVANSVTVANLNGDNAAGAAITRGTLNFGGGNFLVNNDVSLALWANNTVGTQTSVGTLNLTGGTFTVGGNITTSDTASATSTLNLNGGTLDMTNGNINVDSFNAQSGTLKNVAQIQSGDGVTAALLTKAGPGTLAIEGTNTYTGGTSVSGGTLLVDGSITGGVTTSANTTLGGIGSIGGAVTIAGLGNLSPGDSLGTLDIGGALTLSDNSTLQIEIGGLTPGDGPGNYDQVNAGSISLGSNVTLSLSLSFTPNTSSTTLYYIANRADGAPFGNTFAGLAEGATVDLGNGILGTITYQANWSGNPATSSITGGNDVALAIPEPGSVASLLGGLGVLLGMRRSRRRS